MDLEDTVQMPAPLTPTSTAPETRTDRLAAALDAMDATRAQVAPAVIFSSAPSEPIAGTVPAIDLAE
jgi:hypothetical protein